MSKKHTDTVAYGVGTIVSMTIASAAHGLIDIDKTTAARKGVSSDPVEAFNEGARNFAHALSSTLMKYASAVHEGKEGDDREGLVAFSLGMLHGVEGVEKIGASRAEEAKLDEEEAHITEADISDVLKSLGFKVTK